MQNQVDPHPGKEQELEGFPADAAILERFARPARRG
jgi:hypothetical protein